MTSQGGRPSGKYGRPIYRTFTAVTGVRIAMGTPDYSHHAVGAVTDLEGMLLRLFVSEYESNVRNSDATRMAPAGALYPTVVWAKCFRLAAPGLSDEFNECCRGVRDLHRRGADPHTTVA